VAKLEFVKFIIQLLLEYVKIAALKWQDINVNGGISAGHQEMVSFDLSY
jgi:hypothetical protein